MRISAQVTEQVNGRSFLDRPATRLCIDRRADATHYTLWSKLSNRELATVNAYDFAWLCPGTLGFTCTCSWTNCAHGPGVCDKMPRWAVTFFSEPQRLCVGCLAWYEKQYGELTYRPIAGFGA